MSSRGNSSYQRVNLIALAKLEARLFVADQKGDADLVANAVIELRAARKVVKAAQERIPMGMDIYGYNEWLEKALAEYDAATDKQS